MDQSKEQLTETADDGPNRCDGIDQLGKPEDRMRLIANFQNILSKNLIPSSTPIRFDQKIGEGRQGVVFKSRRCGARGCVTIHAVKVFDPAVYSSAQEYWSDMERIAGQVSRLHRIGSPNLVDCDSYEETEGIGYLQMGLVEGVNIGQLHSAAQFEPEWNHRADPELIELKKNLFNSYQGALCIQPGVAVEIMREILVGLESLHAANYLHCDIKPDNIMVDSLGYVKLIDFGRATSIENPSGVLGTPRYMAPEIHARESATIQSDIYSVGLVGLELLSGQKLGEALDLSENELLKLKLRLPEKLNEMLPTYVCRNQLFMRVLQRMLHPVPSARFQSALAAESRGEGLWQIHRQLARNNLDSDYRRQLATCALRVAARITQR